MKLMSMVANRYLEFQYQSIQLNQNDFFKSQQKLWKKTRKALKGTQIYNDQKLEFIDNFQDYVNHVPVTSWDDFADYSEKIIAGETNVLFNDNIEYFGLTSGTSGKDSKRIPYNQATIDLFLRAQKYTAAIVTHNTDINLLEAKRLTFGSAPISYRDDHFQYGYISGILSTKAPKALQKNTYPSNHTLEINRWDEKIEAIIEETLMQDIEVISGIPTYMITIFEAILAKTGRKHIKDIWPNISAFIYGATPINQYRDRLNELIGKEIEYFGIYAATEAPIGLAHTDCTYILNPDLLYTFTPVDNKERNLSVLELQVGKEYVVNIGTPNGFLNYSMKDVIRIHSLNPVVEFEVIGRQNTGMNLAAEKVSEQHILDTIVKIKNQHGIDIRHYFVSPQMHNGKPRYLWTLFVPSMDGLDKEQLEAALDRTLMIECGDYEDCREDKIILAPKVNFLSLDILEVYFKNNQHKGQFKMKTTFPQQNVYESFIADLQGAARC